MKNKKTEENYSQVFEIDSGDLDRIIKESINRVLNEYGVDIDDENKTVSFNPNHENYVDTNSPWNPKPIYNEINGYKVISIFERKSTEDKLDGNPLIYALKGIKGWRFNNPSYDYFALLRRFVAVCKELNEEFDVIIITPSSNSLNKEILNKIVDIIPHNVHFERFFRKEMADDVYNYFLDAYFIEKNFDKREWNMMEKALRLSFIKMDNENNGVFSYKYISPLPLRNAVLKSMSIDKNIVNDENVYNLINNKKILIIDDTVASGKTISDSANAVCEVYNPSNITFLTLFSPLKH